MHNMNLAQHPLHTIFFSSHLLILHGVLIPVHGASPFPQRGIQARQGLWPEQHVCSPNNSPLLQAAWFWLQAHKKVQVWSGWVDWGVQEERERGGKGWKHRYRNWATCQLDVCQAGGLCHSGRVGPLYRGAQLQREELISSLTSCHGRDHQEGNTEGEEGKWWDPRLNYGDKAELYYEDTNRKSNTEHYLKEGSPFQVVWKGVMCQQCWGHGNLASHHHDNIIWQHMAHVLTVCVRKHAVSIMPTPTLQSSSLPQLPSHPRWRQAVCSLLKRVFQRRSKNGEK